MRRFMALIMCLVLIFAMTGCKTDKGQDTNPADTVTEAPTSSSTPVITEAPTPVPDNSDDESQDTSDGSITDAEVTPDASNNSSEAVIPIKLILAEDSLCEFDDDWNYLYRINYNVVYSDDEQKETYPELSETLDAFSEGCLELASSYEDMLLNSALLMREGAVEGEEFPMLTMDSRISVLRADTKVVSLTEHFENYQGGVHGDHSVLGYNYDTKTGKTLYISDIVTDTDAFAAKIADAVRNEERNLLPDVDLDSYVRECMSNEKSEHRFTLGYDGITFFFNTYEIGPYSSGEFQLFVPFKGNESLFKAEYLEVPDRYMLALSTGDEFILDLGNDGTPDNISTSDREFEYGDDEYDEYYPGGFMVYVNDIDFYESSFCNPENQYYFIHDSYGDYIYVQGFGYDYASMYSYKVNENEIESIENDIWQSFTEIWLDEKGLNGGLFCRKFGDPYIADITVQKDIVGTNFWMTKAKINENGIFEIGDVVAEPTYNYELTLKDDMTLETVDAKTGEITGERTLQAGSVISMKRSDRETYLDCAVDGEEGNEYVRFNIGAVLVLDGDYEWFTTVIEGRDAEDLFEGIIYGG